MAKLTLKTLEERVIKTEDKTKALFKRVGEIAIHIEKVDETILEKLGIFEKELKNLKNKKGFWKRVFGKNTYS